MNFEKEYEKLLRKSLYNYIGIWAMGSFLLVLMFTDIITDYTIYKLFLILWTAVLNIYIYINTKNIFDQQQYYNGYKYRLREVIEYKPPEILIQTTSS